MSTPKREPTLQSLLEIVRRLEPVIRAHAPEAERERRLSDAVADAMLETGLYRMWRPKAFGGLEVDPMTTLRVFEEVSRLDSAAGWNLQLSCAIDPFGAWFSDEGARAIFGHPETVLGGAFFPFRRAVPVDGGYRLSGQTPFVSGAHQSTWFFGLANIFEGETPRLGENGEPLTLITACPAGDAVILDTWRTLGMRGTGSHDVSMNDVFVPESRAALLVPRERSGSAYQGPLYRLTIWASVASLASIATGVARAAVEELADLAARKTPAYTDKPLRDRSVVQLQMAQAQATLGAARAYLYQTLEEVWEQALHGHTIDMPDKAKVQLAATYAIVASGQAVDLVHAAAGASAIRDEHRFQRHFRDVHTITQHGFVSASRYESAGQLLLGSRVDWPFFAL
jgi:indole-3-acetate monooxygenase